MRSRVAPNNSRWTLACSVASMTPGICSIQVGAWVRMALSSSSPPGPRQRVTSASISGKKPSSVPNLSVQRPHNRSTPCCDSRFIAVSMNAVLPIPASPVTKAICRWPASICCMRASVGTTTGNPSPKPASASCCCARSQSAFAGKISTTKSDRHDLRPTGNECVMHCFI